MSKKTAVVLVNLGTPAAPTPRAVGQFLKAFLSDPRVVEAPRWFWLPLLHGVIVPVRSRKAAKAYQKIWWPEGSPLKIISQRQVEALQQALQSGEQNGAENTPTVVEACTYGEPSIASQIESLSASGVESFIVIPLYPQYSCSTTAPVWDQLSRYIQQKRDIPDIRVVKSFYQRDDYINALAETVRSHWQQHGRGEKLLMSFHGVPLEYVEKGDPYRRHCEATAANLAATLGLNNDQWLCSFQSRFGPKEWLQPYTDESLEKWAKDGVKRVDVISPAFTADCLETLEELKMENCDLFLAAGGEAYNYIPCLNDSDSFIRVLQAIVEENVTSGA